MKGLFYGVAVSALMLGAGGAGMACDQHAKSAALENPAAATQALNARGAVLAQARQHEQSGATGEDNNESKPEAIPSKAIGPVARSQDDTEKENAEDSKEQKPEAVPSRSGGFVLAQAQQDDQSGTTGEGSKASKPDDEQQK